MRRAARRRHHAVDSGNVAALEQAAEAKRVFLATTSHELKTPLTVISGFAELLVSMPDMPEADRIDALRTIHRRAQELTAMVDRFLLSSRIDSGRVRLELDALDVEAAVRERSEAHERATGRRVDVTVEGGCPAARGDAGAVRTVVEHLLDNATRYSPAGGPVTVLLGRRPAFVTVAVTDRGIGMSAEHARQCFEKFWQAESIDVRRFGGTGIGLYVARALVEAMGGSIAVVSVPGQGTTFTFELPRSEADCAEGVPVEAGVSSPPSLP